MDFKYLDNILIIGGFYEGLTGIVKEEHVHLNVSGYSVSSIVSYSIYTSDGETITVGEKDLKKVC